MILSCCVIRGSLKWVELEGAGIGRWPSKWFDSDTTRNDFSKTFQSLTVLSKMDQPLDRHTDDDESNTVCGKEEMCCILSSAPFDLIYLLLDFERFKIIEFWLVRLKFCIKFVFASFFLEKKRSA